MSDTVRGLLGFPLWLAFGFFFFGPIAYVLKDSNSLPAWPWLVASEAIAIMTLLLCRVVIKTER